MLSEVSTSMVAQLRADARYLSLKKSGVEMDFSGARLTTSEDGSPSHHLTLDHISVSQHQRGQGLGAQAISVLLELADEHGVIVDLEVGYDEQGIGLVEWYSRLGFEWQDGFMQRMPIIAMANPVDRAYHVTTREGLNGILALGLTPQIGPRSQDANEKTEAIYFFASREDTENALMNWMGDCFDDDEELIVLEVDLDGIPQSRKAGQFEIIVTENLPAEKIVFVYDENFKRITSSLRP